MKVGEKQERKETNGDRESVGGGGKDGGEREKESCFGLEAAEMKSEWRWWNMRLAKAMGNRPGPRFVGPRLPQIFLHRLPRTKSNKHGAPNPSTLTLISRSLAPDMSQVTLARQSAVRARPCESFQIYPKVRLCADAVGGDLVHNHSQLLCSCAL